MWIDHIEQSKEKNYKAVRGDDRELDNQDFLPTVDSEGVFQKPYSHLNNFCFMGALQYKIAQILYPSGFDEKQNFPRPS